MGERYPLSTKKKKRLEILQEILQKLAINSKQTVIIVEGKNDRSSLERLGIKENIFCVKKSGKVLLDIIDQLQNQEVILLLDFDNEGKALTKNITQYLERKKIKVNSVFWKKIKSLVRKDIKDIEGLFTYLEKLKRD